MRRKAWMVGLGCASIALCSLCGCSWREILPSNTPTLPNDVAVDRALKLCSLNEGDQPYHLILEILSPARPSTSARGPNTHAQDLHAQVEIYWLNPVTYRVEIRSRTFNQTRIVNGNVVDEHNTGDFYPRWIQNFVDAILDPIPHADRLKKIPGVIPVGLQAHACISSPAATAAGELDQSKMAQVCFQDAEPRIASGVDFTRSVWFDDFAPFGGQMIPRTLINNLPVNLLVRGHIALLEPLSKSDYALLKAREFTPPAKKIQTTLVSGATAQSLLAAFPDWQPVESSSDKQGSPMPIYIRTDRTGRVREAYRDSSDQFGLQDAAVVRALTLKFKPLIVDGAPRQMEAPLMLPSRTILAQNFAPGPSR